MMHIDHEAMGRRVSSAVDAILEAIAEEPKELLIVEALAALGTVVAQFFEACPRETRLKSIAGWYSTLQQAAMAPDDDNTEG